MKYYPNNCQKSHEVVKLYDVRLLLLPELGELREMGTCKEDGLSQHGKETQDGEVQRWVYEMESQTKQRQLFNEGDMRLTYTGPWEG